MIEEAVDVQFRDDGRSHHIGGVAGAEMERARATVLVGSESSRFVPVAVRRIAMLCPVYDSLDQLHRRRDDREHEQEGKDPGAHEQANDSPRAAIGQRGWMHALDMHV